MITCLLLAVHGQGRVICKMPLPFSRVHCTQCWWHGLSLPCLPSLAWKSVYPAPSAVLKKRCCNLGRVKAGERTWLSSVVIETQVKALVGFYPQLWQPKNCLCTEKVLRRQLLGSQGCLVPASELAFSCYWTERVVSKRQQCFPCSLVSCRQQCRQRGAVSWHYRSTPAPALSL